MYKVLVPTDRSDNANHALNYALNLFREQKVEFILFQSFDVPIYTADMPLPIDSLGHEELKRILDNDAEKLRKVYLETEFSFSTRVEIGSLSFNVNSILDELSIDLVVMGTKGASGWEGVIIGSNTSDVIQVASCAVLAIPNDAEIKTPKTMLFASDNKGLSNKDVISPLIQLASRFKAHVHLINVLDEGKLTTVDEAVAGLKLDNLLEGIEHTFHFESGKDKAQIIENYLNTHNIDLLAVVPRRNNFFDAIFHRSVTRKLALHTKIPMLAMHDLG
ncbi:MAG: universal stress protein [Flavobacteriales bacterium]|nr:universal stress protein [Flavobacteriales bacterium]